MQRGNQEKARSILREYKDETIKMQSGRQENAKRKQYIAKRLLGESKEENSRMQRGN